MRLTDEERLGMIAAQQLDAHLEDEDQYPPWERPAGLQPERRGDRMTLQLTDRQSQILAACGLCSRPLKWRSVKPSLETGEVHPPDIFCRRCEAPATCGEITPEVALKAALRMLGRIERAGLTSHYEAVAHDAFMRRQNRRD